MNKKEYVKPIIVVALLESEPMMKIGSTWGLEDEGGYEESYGNKRRGKWGDLWYEEEENSTSHSGM